MITRVLHLKEKNQYGGGEAAGNRRLQFYFQWSVVTLVIGF